MNTEQPQTTFTGPKDIGERNVLGGLTGRCPIGNVMDKAIAARAVSFESPARFSRQRRRLIACSSRFMCSGISLAGTLSPYRPLRRPPSKEIFVLLLGRWVARPPSLRSTRSQVAADEPGRGRRSGRERHPRVLVAVERLGPLPRGRRGDSTSDRVPPFADRAARSLASGPARQQPPLVDHEQLQGHQHEAKAQVRGYDRDCRDPTKALNASEDDPLHHENT